MDMDLFAGLIVYSLVASLGFIPFGFLLRMVGWGDSIHRVFFYLITGWGLFALWEQPTIFEFAFTACILAEFYLFTLLGSWVHRRLHMKRNTSST